MNGEEQTTAAPQGADGGDLEFKPWVKWAAAGVLACVMAGTCLYCYRAGAEQGQSLGYSAGYTAGVSMAVASDEVLANLAADIETAFAPVSDAALRAENEWLLAQTLFNRGNHAAAAKVLGKLFPLVPRNAEWAKRALFSADCFAASAGETRAYARPYYRLAAEVFAECGNTEGRTEALNNTLALLMAESAKPGEELAADLDALLDEAEPLGAPAALLCACVKLHLGQLNREQGHAAEAARLFRETAALLQAAPDSAAAAVCRGLVAMEMGDANAAELLAKAEPELGRSPAETSLRLLALRAMAQMAAAQEGQALQALAYLNRAAGVADVALEPEHAFWSALYDQRGWLLFCEEDYAAAAADFKRAAECAPTPEFRLQPLEGAGRCCMQLNQEEEARRLFDECLTQRRTHSPQDTVSLGRVLLLQAQLCDRMGDLPAALAAYAEAATCLQKPAEVDTAGDDVQSNYRTALLGHAFALSRAEAWEPALAAWELVQQKLADSPERVEEAERFIRECRLHTAE